MTFKEKNKELHIHVWLPSSLVDKILEELKTHGGETLGEQTLHFWNWYIYAKENNQLLKPENQETVPKDPDAPNCEYHVLSGDKWFCDTNKIPREVCLSRYARHDKEGKKCLPEKLEPKPRVPTFYKDRGGRAGIDMMGNEESGYDPFSHRD